MLYIRTDNYKICDSTRGLIPGTFFEVYDSLAPAIRELNLKGYRTVDSSLHPVFGPCITFPEGTKLPRVPSSVWTFQQNVLHVNPLAEEDTTNSKDSIFCAFELYRWACNLPFLPSTNRNEETDLFPFPAAAC